MYDKKMAIYAWFLYSPRIAELKITCNELLYKQKIDNDTVDTTVFDFNLVKIISDKLIT